MIDHLGFSVSDYERAKAFYAKALAPLDYSLIMEVTAEQTGHAAAAGFGANGKPDLWFGAEGAMNKPVHIAILAKDRATVDAFTRSDPYHVNGVWDGHGVEIHGYHKKRG